MRLWSIHPRFLDRMGLLGLWREALHAQRILIAGPPYKLGYGHHPQMERFKSYASPMHAIGYYLNAIRIEGLNRGYKFNRELIQQRPIATAPISVTRGQVNYEIRLLLHKLEIRDPKKRIEVVDHLIGLADPESPPMYRRGWETNPLFILDNEDTELASWERVKEIAE